MLYVSATSKCVDTTPPPTPKVGKMKNHGMQQVMHLDLRHDAAEQPKPYYYSVSNSTKSCWRKTLNERGKKRATLTANLVNFECTLGPPGATKALLLRGKTLQRCLGGVVTSKPLNISPTHSPSPQGMHAGLVFHKRQTTHIKAERQCSKTLIHVPPTTIKASIFVTLTHT